MLPKAIRDVIKKLIVNTIQINSKEQVEKILNVISKCCWQLSQWMWKFTFIVSSNYDLIVFRRSFTYSYVNWINDGYFSIHASITLPIRVSFCSLKRTPCTPLSIHNQTHAGKFCANPHVPYGSLNCGSLSLRERHKYIQRPFVLSPCWDL